MDVIQIKPVNINDDLWERVADYANNCPWNAGEFLAKQMRQQKFTDWEQVFTALDGDNIAGYCTLTKTDCIPDVAYTPFIGFVFVGEEYRGKRVSEKLINAAIQRAAALGFENVYIVSDHVNLYEKYGFTKVDEKLAHWGKVQTIFVKAVNSKSS